jgi:hypothetical protein
VGRRSVDRRAHQARLRIGQVLLVVRARSRVTRRGCACRGSFLVVRARSRVTRRGCACRGSFLVVRARSRVTRRGCACPAPLSDSGSGCGGSPGAVAHRGPSLLSARDVGLVSPGAVAHVRLLSCSAVVDGRWSPGSITHFGSLRVAPSSGTGVHQARLRIGTSSPECRLGAAWTPLPRSRACSAVGSATAAPPPRRNACVRNDDQPVISGPRVAWSLRSSPRATTTPSAGYVWTHAVYRPVQRHPPSGRVTQSSRNGGFGTRSGHPDRVIFWLRSGGHVTILTGRESISWHDHLDGGAASPVGRSGPRPAG